MKPIKLTLEVETFAPAKLTRDRFLIELNEAGELQIRRARAPMAERDTSANMHADGVAVLLKVEADS